MPTLYIAITNHGFGHATRAAAIANEVQQQCPDVLIIFATSAPRWLLESYIDGEFIHRPRTFDIGVIQSDSLTMDKAATLAKLQELQARQAAIIRSEVEFLRQNQVDLILADIPPLAAPIAQAAGIPCWMMSNFGWDFIYRAWGGEFIPIADWIASCFQQCHQLFRLPFHEPMSAFPTVTDVGFTGGSPRIPLTTLQARYGIGNNPQRTVLLTFGGLSLNQIPYHNVQHFPDWQFITCDRAAPDYPNLIKITDSRCRPVDIMPICHCILSKPGYSTFSEACRLGVPVISITRDDFAEAPLLIAGIQDYTQHQIISPTDFYQSRWTFLTQPMQPARQTQRPSNHGNQTIAQAILQQLTTSTRSSTNIYF